MNNGWNQWVLNYTQSRQLDLLKNLGFTSPSWEDLSYLLIGIVVLVSLVGAAWTLWERTQHDPWLRLLTRVRRRLLRAGLDVPETAPPRQIAAQVQQRFGPAAVALHDWLIKLEAQRYAKDPVASLGTLRREFHQLAWPT
jgi:protein-glutamine gamma-glutamyltransferase